MKKAYFFITSLLMINSPCFADANFSSSTGNLVLKDVWISNEIPYLHLSTRYDYVKYDSVTLNLNLETGRFTIIEAIKKDIPPFSETPIHTFTSNGLKVDLYGCVETGRDVVTCMTKFVSLDEDQNISTGLVAVNELRDNLNRQYLPQGILVQNELSAATFKAIRGISYEIKFIFESIDPAATSISLFKPNFGFYSKDGKSYPGLGSPYVVIQPEFKDIPIKK